MLIDWYPVEVAASQQCKILMTETISFQGWRWWLDGTLRGWRKSTKGALLVTPLEFKNQLEACNICEGVYIFLIGNQGGIGFSEKTIHSAQFSKTNENNFAPQKRNITAVILRIQSITQKLLALILWNVGKKFASLVVFCPPPPSFNIKWQLP